VSPEPLQKFERDFIMQEIKERNKEMKRLRFVEKWTADKIAIYYGISRERVFQIVGRGKIDGINRVNPIAARIIQDNKIIQDKLKKIKHLTTGEALKVLGIKGKQLNWNGERHATNHINMKRGMKIEEDVSKLLDSLGIKHELTNSRPFDIILDSGATVEIKARFKTHKNKYSENLWFFNIQRNTCAKNKMPDYFILVIVRENKNIYFIIPREDVGVKNICFCYPPNTRAKKWVQYQDRFDLLTYENSYRVPGR